MITIRKAEERGHANYGWLDTYHTFSFAQYYNPQQINLRSLRVINEVDTPIALMRGILHSRGDALQKQCLYLVLLSLQKQ